MKCFAAVTMLWGFFIWVSGCSDDKKETPSASARLQLANDTAALRLDGGDLDVPSKLEVIIVYANICYAEDNFCVGDVGGPIYVNPDCRDETDEDGASIGSSIDSCGTELGTFEGKEVTMLAETPIDFAKGSTAVNTALNAQNRPISLGEVDEGETATVELNAAAITFNLEGESANNVTWAYDDNDTGDVGFQWIQKQVIVDLDPPLTLSNDEKVRIIVSYDLEETIEYGASLEEYEIKNDEDGTYQPGKADSCTGTVGESSYTCLIMPTISATFEKYTED